MYKSITQWRDLTDGHLYNAGDPFPWDGREIPEDRLAALSCSQNKAGFAVIKLIEEAPKPVEVNSKPENDPKPESEGDGNKAPENDGDGDKAEEEQDKASEADPAPAVEEKPAKATTKAKNKK